MAMLTAWGAAGKRYRQSLCGFSRRGEAKQQSKVRSVMELWISGAVPRILRHSTENRMREQAYNGGYGDIPTNVPGIRVTEVLPNLHSRWRVFDHPRHVPRRANPRETATYLMQTGRMPGDGITYPAIGAVIAMLKSKGYKGKLPPYIALTAKAKGVSRKTDF
ncbi:MAG: hypothetical protein V8T87_04715 [Victivallales bacterium]